MSTRTIIVAGAGGVGKTTISASIAALAAQGGAKTLVLTIDPARRLADALGVEELDDLPSRVAGQEHMWAAMLDVSASWEAIISRYAEPDVGARLLVNPYFRAIADRFPAAQAYAAGERMAEYIESGAYDVLVVDTPPAGGGIDFFTAPQRTGELVSGKLLKWLTGSNLPGRSVLYRFAAKPMLRLADSIIGGPMLSDVADFLLDLGTMYENLSARSRIMEQYLKQATTVIATTADPTPIHETKRFFRDLEGIAITPGLIVFNRALPLEWIAAADKPIRTVPDAALRSKLKANLRIWADEAHRQANAANELAARHRVPMSTVALNAHPPDDLEGLRSLIEHTGIMQELGLAEDDKRPRRSVR